jgi:hypothetical protein
MLLKRLLPFFVFLLCVLLFVLTTINPLIRREDTPFFANEQKKE